MKANPPAFIASPQTVKPVSSFTFLSRCTKL